MMDAKARILVVLTPGFPKDELDTTCLPLQQALLKTIRQNHPELEILVIAFQYPYKRKNYIWNGIPVIAFAGNARPNVFRAYNWAKIWPTLARINRKKNVIGILSFFINECAFIGERFAQRHNIKHHCWILGQDAKPDNHYLKLSGMRENALIALSDFIASSMYLNYGLMPRHIIPGGIDPLMFGPEIDNRDIDVLAAGSLTTLKQYHLFIEVISRLRLHQPNIKAVLCGNGPQRAVLTAMVRKLKMENNISFTGELAHGQVLQLMQRSKVFLHPSSYEGLGMVCLEALYAGAKVISFVKPMDANISNWHIAANTLEMAAMAHSIIINPTVDYTSTMVFDINDIADRMAMLYLDKAAATSLKRPAMALNESVEL